MSDAEKNAPSAGRAEDLVPSANVHADIAALSHEGLVRDNNEDSYAVFRVGRFIHRLCSNIPESEMHSHDEETGHLMVVADGVGGHAAGEVASRTALTETLRLILRSPRWALKLDDPATREEEIAGLLKRLRLYLAGAHAGLREQAERDRGLQGMGTTLTTAYSVGTDMFVMHVGDSRAYVLRRGRLVRITHDHTLAQSYADQGLIPQAEVEKHHLGHVLTRAVGSGESSPESDIHHLGVEHDDRVLLCSDGLSRMASEAEIAERLAANPVSADACKALVTLALERGGKDNVTVIVARFEIADGPAA